MISSWKQCGANTDRKSNNKLFLDGACSCKSVMSNSMNRFLTRDKGRAKMLAKKHKYNKKVLRERKRHTARHVACYTDLSPDRGGGGVSHPVLGREIPHPVLDGEGGNPSSPGWGVPHLVSMGVLPSSPWWGYPGVPPSWSWMGVPPISTVGYPPSGPGMGTPCPDLG